ncbi:MAG: hypothetical protein ABIF89_00065 [bacterium]
MVLDWYKIMSGSLERALESILVFLPKLLGALIVLLIGWFISVLLGKLVRKVLEKVGFNQLFGTKSIKTAMEKAEIKVNAAELAGEVVKWILLIVFLTATAEILGNTQFAVFMGTILEYLGRVIAAVLIFVVAVAIADVVAKIISTPAEGKNLTYSYVVAKIIRWAIWIFAGLAILDQLKIADSSLVQTVLTGVVTAVAIAFGLAFGLGGKDMASEVLAKLRKQIRE